MAANADVEAETVEAEEVAAVARTLAHPARVRIVRLLLERGDCVCGTIVDEIGLAQSTVSEHLRILKAGGVIRGTIDGPRVCYCLNPTRVIALQAFLTEIAQATATACDSTC